MASKIDLERYRLFAHTEIWDSQGVLNMNKVREPVKEAYAEVVANTLGRNVRLHSKILEVGSALGWLTELIPQYKAQITQTEASPELVDYVRRTDPESSIQKQNIYDLTFSPESFDMVVALGVYDVLRDLHEACSETRRVLPKGGKFIHFLDQLPDTASLIDAYQKEGYYAFPGLGGGSKVGFHLISIAEFPLMYEVLKNDIPFLADIMADYVKDPAMMYVLDMSINPTAIENVGKLLNQLSDEDIIIKKTPSQKLSLLFLDMI